jgi:hypothetical protein
MPPGFDGVGRKIKKAWLMKPKQHAGNSSTTQGRSSDSALKAQTQKAPEKKETKR